jgi:hypothetical protein
LYNAARAGQDISQLLQPQNMEVAQTPEQQSQGLRPQHAAGNTNASMAFPDVPPNTPFSTEGMKAPINISKFDEQGHLVQSFKNVPPGIQSLPTGPGKGTVIETPAYRKGGYRAKYQLGGVKKYQGAGFRKEILEIDPRLANNYNSTDATFVGVDIADPYIANRSETQRVIDESLPQQTVSTYEEPSTAAKILNRAANPFTTAGYVVRGQQIPDRVGDKANVYDLAADVVNPAAWVDYGIKANKALYEGDFVGAGLNALGAIPAVPAVSKYGQAILKSPALRTASRRILPAQKANPTMVKDIARATGETPQSLRYVEEVADPFYIGSTGRNEMLSGSKEGVKRTKKFVEKLAEGDKTIDKVAKSRYEDIISPEGQRRLFNQELETIKYHNPDITMQEAVAQANIATDARTAELKQLAQFQGQNTRAAIAVSNNTAGDVSDEIIQKLVKNPYLTDNAYAATYKSYVEPVSPITRPNVKPSPRIRTFTSEAQLGTDYVNSAPVSAHEVQHVVSAHGGTDLPTKLDIDIAKDIIPKAGFENSPSYNYFNNYGSPSHEPTPFLAELRETMLNRGIINSRYDKITPELLKSAHGKMMKAPSGIHARDAFISSHRVFDFMEPTFTNFKNLSNHLNRLPVVGGAVAGGAMLMDPEANENEQQLNRFGGYRAKYQEGGFNEYYQRLPETKNDTSSYNLRRAYELAPKEDLEKFATDPNAHLQTFYFNSSGVGEFMKSPSHPTVNKELDFYYSPKGKEFRNNYDLVQDRSGYKYIPKYQEGGFEDGMRGMMKARIALNSHFGNNPAVQRMIVPPDNSYKFDDGSTGTHYMGSYGDYAIPDIQDVNGKLEMTGPRMNEAIRFDRPEDAEYFAENYKDVAPAFKQVLYNKAYTKK